MALYCDPPVRHSKGQLLLSELLRHPVLSITNVIFTFYIAVLFSFFFFWLICREELMKNSLVGGLLRRTNPGIFKKKRTAG